jgi:23S rRNA (guanine2445-N2)-methyltransferase / 23S rRNA (guanine2069-N7)-methyltransferase
VSENILYWVASAPFGAASVLAEELATFGATDIRERSHDVKFQGSLEVGYRACLWSRTATRVYLSVGQVDATTSESMYEAVKRMDWRPHFAATATLACECSGGNAAIRHTIYGSQRLKDAVCDSLRESTGSRPNISPDKPDVLLHVHVEGPTALVSLDFTGESLHQRGYRTETGAAPLKENVAAAVLLRAGWQNIAKDQGWLVDPMCGSGTFLTEAALIAADAAPALGREYFGFLGWRGHDAALWQRLLEEARSRRAARIPRRCIVGSDRDAHAVRMSIANAEAAGVADWVHVERKSLSEVARPTAGSGLIVTNPPYGERIGSADGLTALYTELGAVMRERFNGWQAAILTGDPPLARNLGIYATRTHRVFNGALECRLLRFDLTEQNEPKSKEQARSEWSSRPGAQMFANRLRKNLQKFAPWAKGAGIECYRVYDADMPEYSFAIDLYGAQEERHAHVQEYAAPKSVNPESARDRRREVLTVLPEVLELPLTRIHSRVRKPQKGDEQYDKRGSAGERVVVQEAGLKFWVNFRDYLDTGLFLDHRIVRGQLRDWAKGADFLNLFCYTGSATVYAAAGGARSTTSVDLSNTYIDWAQDNLKLNGYSSDGNELFREDCLAWLEQEEGRGPRFDLIFLDPPTFSNSKRTESDLDVQRDHVGMIRRAMKLLRPKGRLVFSTNYTRFKLDAAALTDLSVEDISAPTIPKDFERNPKIHRCFVLRFG